MRHVLLFLLTTTSLSSFAQDVLIRGNVVDLDSARRPILDAQVVLEIDGRVADTIRTDDKGFYKFFVGYEQLLRIHYSAPGMVGKNILVDTHGIPEREKGGFGMVMDVKLFRAREGEDYAFLQEPIGKAAYDDEQRNIVWDMTYTQPRLERLQAMHPDKGGIKPPTYGRATP